MSIFFQQLWKAAVQMRFSWSVKSEYCCSMSRAIFLFFQSTETEMGSRKNWRTLLEWYCTNVVFFLHSYMCKVSDTGKKKWNGYQIFPFYVRSMQNHFPCFTVIQFYRVSKYFFLKTLISRGLFNLEINILPPPRFLP